tara:strand:+ start:7555 stop:8208 length:654 start_codon:yes stop_codon:yes gene_type:complete
MINPSLNINSTEFEVDNRIISDFVLNKLIPVVGISAFPINEMMLMVSAVCRFTPTLLFEWGTNSGNSARIFYETIKEFNIDCQINSIELPDDVFHTEHPHEYRGILVKGLPEVVLHQGDGITEAIKIYLESTISGDVMFFIDGDHSYKSVKRELDIILRMIQGAVILVHDTFYQSSDSGYNIDPYLAIKDALRGKNYKVISTIGSPGMTLIYKTNHI